MCSMLDYEMLLPHSPPVFSHSPPTSFLSELASFPRLQRTSSCRQTQHAFATSFHRAVITPPTSPKRPCLVIRPNDETFSSSSDEDPVSPTKLKKKVVFADDKGMSLTHVRVMTEPSNVPPLWSVRFIAEVTQGVTAEPEAQKEPWEVTFSQPASDYIAFRKKLDTKMVSLENVIVKEADDQVVGTVKVKNLAFEKEVFVRSSIDNWKTHEDAFCNFVPNNLPGTGTFVVFDTFTFKLNLPPRSRRLEFCVCFKCDGLEYWDSNDCNNYIIVKKAMVPIHRSLSDNFLHKHENGETSAGIRNGVKCLEATQAKLDSWAQFASWNHLENSAPYW